MELLSRLERALEDAVEGVFSRAFRTQVQPIEIARRLTREVEAHRTVSVNTVYVPNLYTVALSPKTHAAFQTISGRLLGELEDYLREFTAERHYQTVGAIAVRLVEDAEVKDGEMKVNAENDPAAYTEPTRRHRQANPLLAYRERGADPSPCTPRGLDAGDHRRGRGRPRRLARRQPHHRSRRTERSRLERARYLPSPRRNRMAG